MLVELHIHPLQKMESRRPAGKPAAWSSRLHSLCIRQCSTGKLLQNMVQQAQWFEVAEMTEQAEAGAAAGESLHTIT